MHLAWVVVYSFSHNRSHIRFVVDCSLLPSYYHFKILQLRVYSQSLRRIHLARVHLLRGRPGPECGVYMGQLSPALATSNEVEHQASNLDCSHAGRDFVAVHPRQPLAVTPASGSMCPVPGCGKMVKRARDMKRHTARHGSNTFHCKHKDCKWAFFTEHELMAHCKKRRH